MSTNQGTNTPAAAADLPQPAPTLTPEAVVEQLPQIGEVTPLTREQRRTLRSTARTSNPILQASINVIGALDNVSQASRPGDARQMHDEANRWTAVEDELRTMRWRTSCGR
jgi:hypothetical protein